MLLASTSEVYGKNENVPFGEDDDTVLGSTKFSRWSYACSKAIDEFLAFAYHDQYGADIVVARLFNTIGPRQSGQYGMVVPRFVQWALNNEPVLIYGSGKQSRCFSYVGDVVNGLTGLMGNKNAGGGVYNVGSDEMINIADLARRVSNCFPDSPEIKIAQKPLAGRIPERYVPCIDRARKKLGLCCRINLDEAIRRTIAFYQETNHYSIM